MPISSKAIRKQLVRFKNLLDGASLETTRRGQEGIGALMRMSHIGKAVVKEHQLNNCDGVWVLPKNEKREGVLLYLHGGGYISGDIMYTKGVATTIATKFSVKVFAPVYRLAPEYPFPAALDDAIDAYLYLLSKGYPAEKIALIGESAGGGLCYSLTVRLRELGYDLPGSIIAISPWTDMTGGGESYEKNSAVDPTISKKLLDFYADCYTNDRTNPLASPLFADLNNMPPSLIFVGGDEVMLDDAVALHKALLSYDSSSRLIVTPERWHAYVLYGLDEDKGDFKTINSFLDTHLSPENKVRWLRLDNAAKIYPAARRHNWSNVFRLSATLKENVDVTVLSSALDVTVRRFPSIATRLRPGFFWYYLEQVTKTPEIMDENSYPLTRMTNKEISTCALRVIVYKKRIAIEVFHSLTDGTGALIFLKTLVAEYLQQKYNIAITNSCGVLPRMEEPSECELEDSFQKYSGKVSASRRESNAWHLWGTRETAGFLNLTCFKLSVKDAIEKAHEYGVSLNTFLTSIMMEALIDLQKAKVPNPRRHKAVKVVVPVNLRNLFPSTSLRNFALYTTPEIDVRLGEYSFEDICKAVHHHISLDVTPQIMASKIAANVNSERSLFVRIMPLFVKNIVMKAVFNAVAEKKSCITLSNLGRVTVPDEVLPYVDRFDFILGVQATAPHNCGVVSYGDTLYINFIRNIRESELEYYFFKALQSKGLLVETESNSRHT